MIPVDPSISMANSVDRISDLPESIISVILSSLATKEAVATSILSRSWRFRWTKVTRFRFYISSRRKDAAGFVDFVDRVLLNHSGDSITEFGLHWMSRDSRPASVNTWANTAIARNVRVLNLIADSSQCKFHLPLSVYTSGTLEVLKLNGSFRFEPSNVVCLPRLTELDLSCVIYGSDESLPAFISGCPVLESLSIYRRWINATDNLVVCSISSPVLRNISIHSWVNCQYEQPVSGDLELTIDAPALEFLSVYDNFSSHISIHPRLSSVKEVRFEAPYVAHSVIVELYQAFDSVKILTLHSSGIEGAHFSVAFRKLVRLAIHSQHRPRWSCLMDLLGGCTNLKELLFCCRHSEDLAREGDPWRDPARVPSCLVSSLTSLTLTGVEGHEDEMAMLKFFLDHSLRMESVNICRDDDDDPIDYVKRFEVLHQVSQLSRASPTCKIYWLDGVDSYPANCCECFNS